MPCKRTSLLSFISLFIRTGNTRSLGHRTDCCSQSTVAGPASHDAPAHAGLNHRRGTPKLWCLGHQSFFSLGKVSEGKNVGRGRREGKS